MTPTPEQLTEMYEWFLQRKEQQISYPVDDASRNALRAIGVAGASNHATTQGLPLSVGAVPFNTTLTIPVTPTGFFVIDAEGAQYTIAYYT